mmetsp:Transcript_16435/g.31138  ORF Transcript_16435/g.31138 Transcript_16435/m.31138 type:complete len:167 (+) Transcript_16435:61-561(+)
MTSSLATTLAMICCCFMMSLSWCSTGSHAFVVPVPHSAARVTTTAKAMTMKMTKTTKMLRTHPILSIGGGIVPKTKREEYTLYSTSNDDDDDDDDQGKGCKGQGDEEEDARKEETYDNNSDVDHGDIEEEDGIVYNNIDEEYFCNMNRVAKMKVADSSEDESEDSD